MKLQSRLQREAIYWVGIESHVGEDAFPGELQIHNIFIFPGLELNLKSRAWSCKANISGNNRITGSDWSTVTLAFPSMILAPVRGEGGAREEWGWLGVDCWGYRNDECVTGDGFGNSDQMAAGVVSSKILEGTRPLLCSPRWSSETEECRSTSSSCFNWVPLTKGIRKVDQEILPTSSHSH